MHSISPGQSLIRRPGIALSPSARDRAATPAHSVHGDHHCQITAGVTLIELLLALAVVALLVSIAYPSYLQYVEHSRNTQAMTDIAAIDQAIERYRIQSNGALPDNLSQVGKGGLSDPWGNPYRYTRITSSTPPGQVRKDKNLVPINTDYDLYSMGADGASQLPLTAKASRDDIVRANNGDFVGLATDY